MIALPLRNTKRFLSKALKQPVYAVSVALRRVRALGYYKRSDGASSLPEAVTLFLTHRCNLRCKMCGQWGEGGVTKQEAPEVLLNELTLDELKVFVDDVASFKPNITLFGGEPLLYPGCFELVRYIKEKHMHALMITNGSMLEQVASEIVASGLDELNVSLDGGQKLHDQIRGTPGLFDRIIRGLEKVQQYKKEKRRAKPLINLQCTITKYNYTQIEQLIGVAAKINADSLTFHNLIFVSKEMLEKQKPVEALLDCASREWEGFLFEPGIDPKLLDEKRKEILSHPHGFSVDFYPNFSCEELADYYQNPCYRPPAQNSRCLSPWLVAYIFPDGTVRPCLNLNYAFGNIKQERFALIWNNAQAVRFRKVLKENKMFPACARCTELYRY